MLTQEDDVDAHAFRKRGWSISAIARHLGHDRKTIRAYLNGERVAGVRAPAGEDRFAPFVDYCRARLVEDPHVWVEVLLDELRPLGFDQSYATLTRQLRQRGLRPHCEACSAAKGRAVAIIEHPAGEETQWDWVDLPDPPPAWGWGTNASLFVGALAHSGRWRGQLAESKDQAAHDRRARSDHPEPGRPDPGVALRSDGHRLPSADRPADGVVRCRRQALRGVRGDLPATAREPQGRRREGQPHRRAAVVAHPARRHHRRGSAGVARCVLRSGRRHPPTCDRRTPRHRRRPRRT